MTSYPQRQTIPPDTPEIGERYKLLKKLGSGGMGAVFQASDTALEKTVAIKILLPGLSSESIIRFQQEARATAKLDHPNIVKVLDFGQTPTGDLYLIMDYVGPNSLEGLIKKKRRLPLDQALSICIQIAAGLQHAHSHKVLHRDVKPSNIMLSEKIEGNVQLVDFGLAKLQSDEQRLTTTGVNVGSPLYMSPEQAGGGAEVDERSDIYSLGCLMFKALTGSPPIQGETYMDTIMLQREETAPLLNDTNCGTRFPAVIETIVAKALEKHPEDRFQSASELKHALMNALEACAANPVAKEMVAADGKDLFAEPGANTGAPASRSKIGDLANKTPIIAGAIVLAVLFLALGAFLFTDHLVEQPPSKPVHVRKPDQDLLLLQSDQIVGPKLNNEKEFQKDWEATARPKKTKNKLTGDQVTYSLKAASMDPDPRMHLCRDKDVLPAIADGRVKKIWDDPEFNILFNDPEMIKLGPKLTKLWASPKMIKIWSDPVVLGFLKQPKLWTLWNTNNSDPRLAKFRTSKNIDILMHNEHFIGLSNDSSFQKVAIDKRFQRLVRTPLNIKVVRAVSSCIQAHHNERERHLKFSTSGEY